MGLKTCLALLLAMNAVGLVKSLCIPVCENSGACVNTVCSCVNAYWGLQCQNSPGCSPDPCNGHGACANGVDGAYTCTCTDSWTGTNCDGTPPPCVSWTSWGACSRPCGGCTKHKRSRTCTDTTSPTSEEEPCNVIKCVAGLHSVYEYFYQWKNGHYGRYGRNRECCYNFNVDPPTPIPSPKYCMRPKVGGWQ